MATAAADWSVQCIAHGRRQTGEGAAGSGTSVPPYLKSKSGSSFPSLRSFYFPSFSPHSPSLFFIPLFVTISIPQVFPFSPLSVLRFCLGFPISPFPSREPHTLSPARGSAWWSAVSFLLPLAGPGEFDCQTAYGAIWAKTALLVIAIYIVYTLNKTFPLGASWAHQV